MAILIDNFSVGLEDWAAVSDLVSFYVDVVDLNYSISTSGTYFMMNEVPVFTTLSGISNGYTAYCDVPSISGSILVTIHAENDNSEVVEENYSFLFGYHVETNEVIDWEPNNEVVVWSIAANNVECSNTETFGTFFHTRDYESKDLGASICSIEGANLGAEIHPQSKSFLYGFTYTIIVSGIKDYSGNIMEPIEFSFTIEEE